MSFCMGFFPPSQTLEPYLRQFLRQYSSNADTEFFELAKLCDQKMRSVKKNGPRQCNPTHDELLITQGRPLFVKVVFPDDAVKTFEVNSATLGKEFVDIICNKIRVDHPEDYAVYLQFQETETMLFGNEYLMDSIALTEIAQEKEVAPGQPGKDAGKGKAVAESAPIRPDYKLYFRRFLWPRSQEVNFNNEAIINIIYHQNAKRLMNDEIRISFSDALLYTATAVRLATRDSAGKSATQKEEFYQRFIIPSHFKTIALKEWVSQIDESIKELEGTKNHDIKSKFVRRILTWPSFGESQFILQKPVSLSTFH